MFLFYHLILFGSFILYEFLYLQYFLFNLKLKEPQVDIHKTAALSKSYVKAGSLTTIFPAII